MRDEAWGAGALLISRMLVNAIFATLIFSLAEKEEDLIQIFVQTRGIRSSDLIRIKFFISTHCKLRGVNYRFDISNKMMNGIV